MEDFVAQLSKKKVWRSWNYQLRVLRLVWLFLLKKIVHRSMGHVIVGSDLQSRDIWYFLTAVVVSSMDTRSRIHECEKDRNPIWRGQGLHERVCELAVASSIRFKVRTSYVWNYAIILLSQMESTPTSKLKEEKGKKEAASSINPLPHGGL